VARIASSLVAVGEGGRIVRTTALLGNTGWAEIPSASSSDLFDVVGTGTYSYAVGAGGTILQGTLLGTAFGARISGVPTNEDLRDIALMGSDLLAVGDAGTIVRSVDGGLHWSKLTVPTEADLHAVAVSGDGSYAVATGAGGVLLWSVDGAVWNLSGASPFVRSAYGATFANGWFVIVGAEGLVARAQPASIGQPEGWGYTGLAPSTWGDIKRRAWE
jgi:photosystem II stability/assembly factor-like uncharacterized protein